MGNAVGAVRIGKQRRARRPPTTRSRTRWSPSRLRRSWERTPRRRIVGSRAALRQNPCRCMPPR